jgi:endonuclease/exonuclease/phosphatase family metal-dependent hydrolase
MRLPKGDGAEVRALVAVEYEDMVVAGTHLDYRSEAAQIGQVEALTDTLKAMYGHKGKPVFLCGDMNAVPGSGTMDRLREDWEILSPLEATYADRCIDYILVLKGSAECEVVAGEVGDSFDAGSPYEASDHLPVWIEVRF